MRVCRTRILSFRSTIFMHPFKTTPLYRTAKLALVFALMVISMASFVSSDPTGPTITILGNTTKTVSGGSIHNSTMNGTSPAGTIFTSTFTATQQNTRWKAYVGNVTGTLVLDDAQSNTLFQWTLTAVSGEVYATRHSGSINWTGINCTWRGENVARYNESNRTIEELENAALSHTNKDDNITTTFRYANHTAITVGSKIIGKNECFALQTQVNDAAQQFTDSNTANFTQVILYDGTNATNGKVVYETKIENDKTGYRSDSTYDFQIILPEVSSPGFTGSTAYYFYVELS